MEAPCPCLACGACCACFRASFYWGEANDAKENGVPVELTDKLNDFRRVMKGTAQQKPWCIALKGIIGKAVHCAIYPARASVCREFAPAWQEGEPNERCDQARAFWGLAPLTPNFWSPSSPGKLPRAA